MNEKMRRMAINAGLPAWATDDYSKINIANKIESLILAVAEDCAVAIEEQKNEKSAALADIIRQRFL